MASWHIFCRQFVSTRRNESNLNARDFGLGGATVAMMHVARPRSFFGTVTQGGVGPRGTRLNLPWATMFSPCRASGGHANALEYYLERFHVDHEAVFDVAFDHPLVGFVDLLDGDQLDIGGEVGGEPRLNGNPRRRPSLRWCPTRPSSVIATDLVVRACQATAAVIGVGVERGVIAGVPEEDGFAGGEVAAATRSIRRRPPGRCRRGRPGFLRCGRVVSRPRAPSRRRCRSRRRGSHSWCGSRRR